MGGVGKSELALQHAYDSFDLYRGGILRLDARQGLEAMALQVVTFFRGRFPDVSLPEDRSPTELLPVCWSQWPANARPPMRSALRWGIFPWPWCFLGPGWRRPNPQESQQQPGDHPRLTARALSAIAHPEQGPAHSQS